MNEPVLYTHEWVNERARRAKDALRDGDVDVVHEVLDTLADYPLGPSVRSVQMLTQVEFEGDDFENADKIVKALGYEQSAYTSTSALWGLFCLPENPKFAKPGQRTDGGCLIKTLELGFLFVQDGEDVHLGYDYEDALKPKVSS